MPGLPWRQRSQRGGDEEAEPSTPTIGSVKVDLTDSDDRWTIDVNIDNIITRIVSRSDSRLGDGDSEVEKSYHVNFAVLQRIHISQLRAKLVRQAVDLRFNARQPPGWAETLHQYTQALQDYEYMEKRHLLPNDPFHVSGTHFADRAFLEHLIGNKGTRIQKTAVVTGPWDSGADPSTARLDNRRENYRRSWARGFYERIGVAAISGAFLIAPMWLMVLHNTLYTGLASTTGFVTVFGLTAAAFLRTPTEVMSCTAAYAAVLVVFVGLTTESVREMEKS